ncbi:MAG: cytochrome c oxidase subunit II [Rhodospirillales bacterium]|nr:cytochrome c oxidase subunit II [Rhodospirillales bacterium]
MIKRLNVLAALSASGLFTTFSNAFALEGKSIDWQMGMQPAGSPVMERIREFHGLLLTIEVLIVLFVLVIMAIIVIRFNAKANPVPSKFTHNTVLEIIWTAAPILILVVIAVPSLKLLYYSDRTQEAEMTLKVTGHQWYWSYQYPDHGGFEFDSNLVPKEDLKKGQPRLLTVDNRVVLPVGTTIRVLLTSNDVIHNWAIPSFGIKLDTVPGRINETWVKINEPGTYYGMCSELCGVNHGFMPIQVEAVSKEAFEAWTEKAKKEFAKSEEVPLRVAQTAPVGR